MRSFQVFASMSAEDNLRFMKTLADGVPAMFAQAVAAASAAMKARPVYLQKQPFEKRAAAVRRALSRVASNTVADEVLAVYFLDCKKELLTEWLDLLGLKHEEGILQDDVIESPDPSEVEKHVATFRSVSEDEDRELLLQTFSAQAAIDWPALDALVEDLAPAR